MMNRFAAGAALATALNHETALILPIVLQARAPADQGVFAMHPASVG
jgi:hypothetical protein